MGKLLVKFPDFHPHPAPSHAPPKYGTLNMLKIEIAQTQACLVAKEAYGLTDDQDIFLFILRQKLTELPPKTCPLSGSRVTILTVVRP